MFSPALQSAKFDPNATYIKRWIPELADISPKNIHKGELSAASIGTYPANPIVDFAVTRDYWLAHYHDII